MANLPFIVKIFSSCFTTNDEDPLVHRRIARTHRRTCQSRTDSDRSSTDSHSLVVASTSTSTISEEECGSSRPAKRSTFGTRRHIREMDMRPNRRKRPREETLHLSDTSLTHQEASYLTDLTERDGEEPRRKRHHVSLSDYFSDEASDMSISGHLAMHRGLDKARALSCAKTKATFTLFRRELNFVKSQLNIAQARCELLQDENRWLRANMQAEEDCLLQCEVEMLLANKSQLALDNAHLMRERERLLLLVEYLQTELLSISVMTTPVRVPSAREIRAPDLPDPTRLVNGSKPVGSTGTGVRASFNQFNPSKLEQPVTRSNPSL